MNLAGVLAKLKSLVAFDTQNPPRSLDASSPIFGWVSETLGPDFEIDITDHGLGRVSMLAVRGEPSLLFNVHLDTVPTAEGWKTDPHRLEVRDGRAYGLGACDIKGAAAALAWIPFHSQDSRRERRPPWCLTSRA